MNYYLFAGTFPAKRIFFSKAVFLFSLIGDVSPGRTSSSSIIESTAVADENGPGFFKQDDFGNFDSFSAGLKIGSCSDSRTFIFGEERYFLHFSATNRIAIMAAAPINEASIINIVVFWF